MVKISYALLAFRAACYIAGLAIWTAISHNPSSVDGLISGSITLIMFSLLLVFLPDSSDD